MTKPRPLRVHVQGAGKVGRAIAVGLDRAGWPVRLRAARRGPPVRTNADVIILAVRDGQLAAEAENWINATSLPLSCTALHVAGALDAEVLAVLRPHCRGVGQMHPLVCIASEKSRPDLRGTYTLVSGDPPAVRAARRIARALGMQARQGDDVNRTAYHAAAWLVAGGVVALCAAAQEILIEAGIDADDTTAMIASLVASVGVNVETVGLPSALTGVVRRGDHETLNRHMEVLRAVAPQHVALYTASALAQLPLAQRMGDIPTESLNRLESTLSPSLWQRKVGAADVPDCKQDANETDSEAHIHVNAPTAYDR